MTRTAKKVPYSSVVGQSIMVVDETGAAAFQLAILNVRTAEGESYRIASSDIADWLCVLINRAAASGQAAAGASAGEKS